MSTIRIPHRFRPVALSAISAVLLTAACPPLSVPFLPFVSLVPLLLVLRRCERVRDLVVATASFAVPYVIGHVYWLWYLGRFTPAGYAGAVGGWGLQVLTACAFPLFVFAFRRGGGERLWWAIPFAWVVTEHARWFGDFSFPWITLGNSLSEWPRLIQHADVVGTYGLSLWIAACNVLVAEVFARRSVRARAALIGGLLVVLAAPVAYSAWRWANVAARLSSGPRLVRIAAVQPNVPQHAKWRRDEFDRTVSSLDTFLRAAEARDVSLVVAPEASLPMVLPRDGGRLPERIAAGRGPVLIGALVAANEAAEAGFGAEANERRWFYNSAVLVDPERFVVDRHDKHYLVPMTEQFPYLRVFRPFLELMRAQFGRFLPGERLRPIPVPHPDGPVHVAPMICYEAVYPEITRGMVRGGADLLAVLTNDAWFGRSSMPHQHLGFLTVRAIEARRSGVMVANTGFSAFVDPLGRVSQRTALFEGAVLDAAVPILTEETLYTRVGDVALWVSYGATLLASALAWAGWRRKEKGHGS